MTITGLDKRIALFTMSKIGASSRSIIIGAIVVTIVLSRSYPVPLPVRLAWCRL